MPSIGPLGPQEEGKDFNFFAEISVSGDGYFTEEPQAFIKFRGPRRMLFVCRSGDIYYSFNGNTVHGRMISGEPSEKLFFDVRGEDKIWVRGSGTIQIHAWHIGV
jgi:hypothetical protein